MHLWFIKTPSEQISPQYNQVQTKCQKNQEAQRKRHQKSRKYWFCMRSGQNKLQYSRKDRIVFRIHIHSENWFWNSKRWTHRNNKPKKLKCHNRTIKQTSLLVFLYDFDFWTLAYHKVWFLKTTSLDILLLKSFPPFKLHYKLFPCSNSDCDGLLYLAEVCLSVVP